MPLAPMAGFRKRAVQSCELLFQNNSAPPRQGARFDSRREWGGCISGTHDECRVAPLGRLTGHNATVLCLRSPAG
jgi:hypothetical protein